MSQQHNLQRIIIDLEDLAESINSIDAEKKIKEAIKILEDIRIYESRY